MCTCGACKDREEARYADLAHWLHNDGGTPLDGPVLLTDEPTGDAMRWTPQEEA